MTTPADLSWAAWERHKATCEPCEREYSEALKREEWIDQAKLCRRGRRLLWRAVAEEREGKSIA